MADPKDILGPNPTPGGALGDILAPEAEREKMDPFASMGVSGLRRFSQGYSTIEEEWLNELKGSQGIKAYREMSDNSAVIGAVLFLIDSFVRKVEWEVDPATDDNDSKGWAVFVEECIEDLQQSWPNLIGEIMRGICIYGWSTFELVFKQRQGPSPDEERTSKFNDNRIGWAKIAPRSQDSLYGWQFDENGAVEGMYQMAPPQYEVNYIPIKKLLLFRSVGVSKDNPQGRSPLRNCYIPYTLQKKIQISEAIGISRNLAGLPVMNVPLRLMSESATANEKLLLDKFQDMVSRVKSDEYSGLVLPSETTQDGNPTGYKFQLLPGTTGKTAETTPVIERLERNIARAFLADWLFLGSGTTGSWALSSNKTNMFAQALGGFLSSVTEVLNDAIAQLMQINGNDNPLTYPTIRHGDLEKMPIEEISAPLTALVSAGVVAPDDSLEEWIREQMGAPLAENAARMLPIEPTEDTEEEGIAPQEGEEEQERNREGIDTEGEEISAVTLNGAQVASLLQIIEQVATGQLPRESALHIISAAFNMEKAKANELLGSVGQGFIPASTEEASDAL